MTMFATLHPDGSLTNVKHINQQVFASCPFTIFDLSHYRTDGTCKCNDKTERAKMIKEWGYSKKDFKNIPLI